MYSIPFTVDTNTDINDVIACLSDLLLTESMFSRNLKFYYCVILNISLRINYSTKFFLNYGAIWSAFTRKDSKIYITPSVLF